MLSRYGFCDKAEPVASSVFDGKAAEGKNRRYESKEDAPTVVFRPRTSALGAVCLISRTTWARSTEQRYKKKSNYKR